MRWLGLVLAAWVVAAWAGSRQVLGTFAVSGDAEASADGVTWQPLHSGGAALDGTRLRVADGGWVSLRLATGERIRFAGGSAASLGTGGAPAVALVAGSAEVLFPPGAGLRIEAARGTVRAPADPAGTGGPSEATIAVVGDTLVVRGARGTVELVTAAGVATPVAAGREARLAPGADAPTVVASADGDRRARAAGAGFLGAAGVSPLVAALVGGGVAVGAGVGGAAASGAFSSSADSTDAATGANPREGSPFRPIRSAR